MLELLALVGDDERHLKWIVRLRVSELIEDIFTHFGGWTFLSTACDDEQGISRLRDQQLYSTIT